VSGIDVPAEVGLDTGGAGGHDRFGGWDNRTVLVYVFEAEIGASPSKWAEGWQAQPLSFGDQDPRSGLAQEVSAAVVDNSTRQRRFSRDLSDDGLNVEHLTVLAIEAVRLFGLNEPVYLLALHVALAPESLGTPSTLDVGESGSLIEALVGAPVELSADWTARESASSRPYGVAELVCVPDSPAFLRPPRFGSSAQTWLPYQQSMYELASDDPLFDPTRVQEVLGTTIEFLGGQVLVGNFRTVAVGDGGYEAYQRTIVLDALLFACSESVMLRRLGVIGSRLVDPASAPQLAAGLSRAVTAYTALYSWNSGGRLEVDHQIIARFRELNGVEGREEQLGTFAATAQTAVATQTNILLALIAVLGFAISLAAAVISAAALEGWSALWGVAIAVVVTGALLALPFSRSLRASTRPGRRT
jgi:hypothetical protein